MGPSVTGVTGGCRRAWPLLLSAPCPNAPSGWSARWRVPRRSSAACECVAQTRHSRRRGGTSGGRLFARPRFAGASGWPVGYIAGSRGPEVAGPSWAAARAERPGDTGRPGRPGGKTRLGRGRGLWPRAAAAALQLPALRLPLQRQPRGLPTRTRRPGNRPRGLLGRAAGWRARWGAGPRGSRACAFGSVPPCLGRVASPVG